MPTLQRQGPASYTSPDPIVFSTWLVEQGYVTEDPRSAHEYLRLRKAKSLLVVYHNGTVLLQGADVRSAHALLATLVPAEEAVSELPF